MLGFDDAWSLETPRIENHSITEPINLIVLGGYNTHYFETLPKKHGVTAPSDHIVVGYD